MSRSYRRPYVKDGYKGSKRKQFFKRVSNKVVRRSADIMDGNAYRKLSDAWNICDYRWYMSKEDLEDHREPWKITRK